MHPTVPSVHIHSSQNVSWTASRRLAYGPTFQRIRIAGLLLALTFLMVKDPVHHLEQPHLRAYKRQIPVTQSQSLDSESVEVASRVERVAICLHTC